MSGEDITTLTERIQKLEANMRSAIALLSTATTIVEDTRIELVILNAKVSAAVAE